MAEGLAEARDLVEHPQQWDTVNIRILHLRAEKSPEDDHLHALNSMKYVASVCEI